MISSHLAEYLDQSQFYFSPTHRNTMNNNIKPTSLRNTYLFEALDNTQLTRVIASSQTINLDAKQTLFAAGQPADNFYLLQTGQLKLFGISADGDEKVLEIIHPGETFAEAIMFMQKNTYPVYAEAITDCQLYSFNMQVFTSVLRESTDTCFTLMASMSRLLRARVNDINHLSLHNATYRLVVFLIEQLPEDALQLSAIHLNTPKSIIASRLSIQPETFSRILKRLSKQGLIKVHGNDVTLLDVEGLKKLL
jgi:CRP/FNR family transcriptional regulator, dissimilatory nitrate respiration regulator